MEDCLMMVDNLINTEMACNNDSIEKACKWLLAAQEDDIGERIPSVLMPSSKIDELCASWENHGHVYAHVTKTEGVYDMIGYMARRLWRLLKHSTQAPSSWSMALMSGMAKESRKIDNEPLRFMIVIHDISESSILRTFFRSMAEAQFRTEGFSIKFSFVLLHNDIGDDPIEAQLMDHLYCTRITVQSPMLMIRNLLYAVFVDQLLPIFWTSSVYKWILDLFTNSTFDVEFFRHVMHVAIMEHFSSNMPSRMIVCDTESFLNCWLVFGASVPVSEPTPILEAFESFLHIVGTKGMDQYAQDIYIKARDQIMNGQVGQVERLVNSVIRVLEDQKRIDSSNSILEAAIQSILPPNVAMEKVEEVGKVDEVIEQGASKRLKLYDRLFGQPARTLQERQYGPPKKVAAPSEMSSYIARLLKCFRILVNSENVGEMEMFKSDVQTLEFRILGQMDVCSHELRRTNRFCECCIGNSEALGVTFAYYDSVDRLNLHQWYSHFQKNIKAHSLNYETWVSYYPKWRLVLERNMSILLSGVGTKNGVLRDFMEFQEDTYEAIIANGFEMRASEKLVEEIAEHYGLSNILKWGKTLYQKWALIKRRLARVEKTVCVYIFNIDGPAFMKTQEVLCEIGEMLPLVATVDNERMNQRWDLDMVTKFHWWSTTVHTYEPYQHLNGETRDLLTVEYNKFTTLQNLLWKIPASARKCYRVLCTMVLEKGLFRAQQPGISLNAWLKEAGPVKREWIRDWVEWGALQAKSEDTFQIPLVLEEVRELEEWLEDTSPKVISQEMDSRFIESVLGLQRIGIVTIGESSGIKKLIIRK